MTPANARVRLTILGPLRDTNIHDIIGALGAGRRECRHGLRDTEDMPQRLRGTENIEKDSLRLGVSGSVLCVETTDVACGGNGCRGAVRRGIDSHSERSTLERCEAAGTAQAPVPNRDRIFPKGGDPPHFKAFVTDQRSGLQTLMGLAFWTTELDPLERGYDGPIKMLVGMDTNGLLTGIIVTEHHEPCGDFSVDRAEFAAQFRARTSAIRSRWVRTSMPFRGPPSP